MNRKITLILPLFILGFLFNAQAQCPPNIDFETAGTADWLYWRGSCYNTGTAISYTFTSTAPVPGLHTLTTMVATDAYGGFPVVAPGGGLHSLRLGKDSANQSTMKCAYNVHVPSGPGLYSFIYRYAVVLENPGTSHAEYQQPRFIVEARDSITGNIVACDSYNYVGDGSEPGFLASSIPGSDVTYKTWTMGNLKFPGEAGKTATVSFVAQGCTLGGHFGYGYLDMSCGFVADNIVTCASGTTTLTGPDGYSGYSWTDSLTFTATYGTSQSVVVTSPTVTTTYAVILTPYSGYGCTDTLYTKVYPTSLTLHPTHDTTICSGTAVTLSMGAITPYSTPPTYLWGPSLGLSCVTCVNPVATPSVSTNYYCTVTDSAGCQLADTIHMTVVGAPGPITGPLTVCQGQTITLSDSPPGGTWTSTAPGIASIAAVSGVVTGVTVGTTAIITYTLGGSCKAWRGVTVVADPAPITGGGTMCIGTSTTLFDATSGGTWSSTSGLISIVGSSGVVTGISATTAPGAMVTYTMPSGCFVTKYVTVNPSPFTISGSGTLTVCVDGNAIEFDGSPGGTWSASPSLLGTINPVTGNLTGLSAGIITITYTLSTGCLTTATVNVQSIPGPISGPTQVCIGDTITLTDPTSGGIWVVSGSGSTIYIPNPSSGVMVGVAPGGVDSINYTAGTSPCPSIYVVTVNPLTSPITVPGGGPAVVCVGQTLLLTDADAGVWSASNPLITTIGSATGLVNGIAPVSDTITFTNTLGCKATMAISVNPLPMPITGLTSLCVGTTITLTDATPGGIFTTSGPHAIVSPSGTVTGMGVGTQLITYTVSGCYVTYLVTVNTTPPHISGVLSVCQGATTVLFDSISGGIWNITPTSIATIIGTITTATVTGVAPGTATVTYTLGVGCSTSSIVTVNPMPGPITLLPATAVCVGSTITASDPTSPGGTWSPITGTYADINAITGVITGINNGLQVFTYTATTGCTRPVTVNVNPLPLSIAGPTTVCVGSTITLTDGSGGGTWTSLNPTIATIVGSTGVLTGVAGGSATIRYQLASGCATAAIVSVNPIPPLCTMTPATGTHSYCASGTGITIGLTCSSVGINYTLKNGGTAVATLPGTGSSITFGPQTAAGAYTIVATYPSSGCFRTMTGTVTVSINPLPVITGPTGLCVGAIATLSSSIPGSTWGSSIPGNASVGFTTGIVTGITTGSSTVITCTAPTGCTSNVTVNVTPSPTVVTGPATVCVGDSVLFTDGVPGGSWTSSAPIVASAGTFSGYIYGISPGTATITYSLGSGCQQTKSITVIGQPASITTVSGAPMVICQGASLPLHDATTPGTWSIAPVSSALATVSGTGVVTADITGGTLQTQAAVVYTSTSTSCQSWAYVTINPLPAPITGTFQVCQGSSTVLTDPTSGGSWSISTTAYASISTASGTLTGINAGSPSIVSFTVAGCSATQPVTVNPLPGIITGTSHICTGDSLTLSSSSPGGTWTVAPVTTATINPTTGSIYGIVPGTGVVTYTLPTTCLRTIPVTVNQTPAPITGPSGVCIPNGASMADPTAGGAWSSSNPAIASIGAATGLITTGPTLTGTVTISYTVGSCAATTPFNVSPHPLPITGTLNVCVGSTTTLADATPGGAWSSGSPSLGSVSTSGVVTGISSGTVIITYGAVGCNSIAPVVVNPITPVIGDSVVCVGQTIGLTDATLGGVWTSTISSIASAGYTTGIITGVSAGTTATINYTILATGCTAPRTITVNPLPSAISGPATLCVGQTGVYTDPTSGGVWSTSNPTLGSIDASGNLTGIANGTINVTYTLSATSCYVTYPVVINGLPSAISGPSALCLGSTANYTDASGAGTWTSSATAIATILPTTGTATANPTTTGTTTIAFTLSATGCVTTMPVNVINPPTAIYSSVPAVICEEQSLTLYDSSGAGTWALSSSAIASVTPAGVVTGLLPGTDTVTYSTGAGCVTPPFVVTVNQTPNAPTSSTGSFSVCVGQTLTLSTYPTGGTWSSVTMADATITSLTGVVTGVAAGSSVISYVLPATGCAVSTLIFVNATPLPITGINTVCIGMTSPLADATPGGAWSSSTAAATVSTSGVVSGVSSGTTTISYLVGGTACPAMMDMTVNPVPGPISATTNTVCVLQSIVFADAVPGSGWSSDNTGIATVSSSGVVTGVSGGTTTITYTLGAGCYVDTTVNVIALPGVISGGDSVCQGQSLFFTDPTPSGTWTSTVPTVGNIGATSGVMTGVAAGTTTISYTVNGCSVFQPVTVDVQPAVITGNPIVCLGGTSALSDAVGGGVWSSSNSVIAPVSTTGVVFGSAVGSATITYMHSPGACYSSLNVTVVPLPLIFNVTGGGAYCDHGIGVNIGLNGSTVGVNYMLYNGLVATGSFGGTGSPIGFGLQTVVGSYTVIGTATATGCSVTMAGSAPVSTIPNSVPAVNLTITPDTTVCTGTTVVFTPAPTNGGPVPVYQWHVNGTSVATSNTYTFIPANGDVVGVTMTSNAICPLPATASDSQRMHVQPFGHPSLTLTSHPGDTVCQGTVADITINPVYGGNAPLFTWMKNGVIVSSASDYSFLPVNNDVIYCIMQSNYPCRLENTDTSANLVIKIDTPMVPVVTIATTPGTMVQLGAKVTMTASVVNGGVDPTYQWFKNSVPVAGATTNVYTDSASVAQAADSISCQVTSSGYCRATGHQWVYIQVANVGVGQLTNTIGDISVVPNPNKGDFIIKGSVGVNNEEVNLELTDVLGQVVYTSKVIATGGKLNEHVTLGTKLANGMYILSVRTAEESRVFHMVIEQ